MPQTTPAVSLCSDRTKSWTNGATKNTRKNRVSGAASPMLYDVTSRGTDAAAIVVILRA